MVKNLLNIVEIFQSIQGEGARVGTSAVFIRFAGCNLNCKFCDTNKETIEQLTPNEIMVRISKYSSENIILTGGEPLIQNLAELINKLSSMGYDIAIETNGTLYPDWLGEIIHKINWIIISPKLSDLPIAFEYTGLANEVKIVWHNTEAPHNLAAVDHIYQTKLKFIQPMDINGNMNIDDCLDLIYNKYPSWRISIQLHKLLGLR
jgi:organic radical activating enzyme